MFDYHRLLQSLDSDLAVDPELPLTSDLEVKQAARVLLRRSFYKKLLPTGELSPKQIAVATEKFLRINRGIASSYEYPAETEQDALFWSYFKDQFDKTLNSCEADYSLDSLREYFATGPGASMGADNRNFYTKLFASQLTTTSEFLITLYRGLVCESDTWAEAERLRFERFGFSTVVGNRLFFVPKDVSTARSCCTEPSLNMVLQKALDGVFRRRLAQCFEITLEAQPVLNRRLARLGSLDDSFATIDLESASDSISWSLVKTLTRGRLSGLLREARSPNTILPDGAIETLNMVSTMGNGFTFSLQTIIFACAVRAVYLLMGFRSSVVKGDFGVFGDDIVVRREAYHFVVRQLTKLGFRVNDAKSFAIGPFRESCGHDYFRGKYVRGVYIRSLETLTDVHSAVNRLNRWSAIHEVPLLSTVRTLLGSRRWNLVPFSEALDSGIQVPFTLTAPRVSDGNYWFLYRKHVARPTKLKVPDSGGFETRRPIWFNPYGIGVSYLGGYARRTDPDFSMLQKASAEKASSPFSTWGFFTLRTEGRRVRYKVARGSIPFWDWLGPEADLLTEVGFSFDSWKRVVAESMV